MPDRLPLLLDVDTGVDDALALALAVRAPNVELLGVTTVAGNVTLDHTTENTLRVLDALGAGDVPVHRGFSRPLARPLLEARNVHGEEGLGGYALPPASRGPERPSAPDFLIERILAMPGEVTLVCTGPLTNLAAAIALEPALPDALRRLVIMGGALGRGNVTPYAEFNIYVDPEAAAQVFAACRLTMVGLDVTQRTSLTRAAWERLDSGGDVVERLARGVTAQTFLERGRDEFYLHDPLAVGVALDPTLCAVKTGVIEVETATAWRAGKTSLIEQVDGPHAACVDVDAPRFLRLFGELLGLPTPRYSA